MPYRQNAPSCDSLTNATVAVQLIFESKTFQFNI